MATFDPALVGPVLHACKKAAPDPWLPRYDPMTRAYPEEELKAGLDWLMLSGYVQMGIVSHEEGWGVVLTSHGQRGLEEPSRLEQIQEKARKDQSDPYTIAQRTAVKDFYQRPIQPLVRKYLLIANILVFLYGIYLASNQNVPLKDFILGNQANAGVRKIIHEIGSVTQSDILQQEWWRLITACFVHIGILHILMNMYALYLVGRDVEQTFGHARFLIIYLISGIVGSCTGVYASPGGVAGASGAICGLIGAIAMWLFLNKRFMPKQMFTRSLTSLLFTGIMLAIISMIPGVSGAGHLGGAIAGAVAAVLMHFQRFGRFQLIRAASLVIALAIPVVALLAIEPIIRNRPDAEKMLERIAEERDFDGLMNRYWDLHEELMKNYQDKIALLLDQLPERRDEEQVEKVLKMIPELQERVRKTRNAIDSMKPFLAGKNLRVANDLLRRLESWRIFYTHIEAYLKRKLRWDEKKVEQWSGHLKQEDPR